MWKWPFSNKSNLDRWLEHRYLTVIGAVHSAKWGWSWTDMAANILGSGLYISQQLDGRKDQNSHFTIKTILTQCLMKDQTNYSEAVGLKEC
jgi:hypothetical protein